MKAYLKKSRCIFSAINILCCATLIFVSACASNSENRPTEKKRGFTVSQNSEIYITILLPPNPDKEELLAAKLLSKNLRLLGRGKIFTTDIPEYFTSGKTIRLKRQTKPIDNSDILSRIKNESQSSILVLPERVDICYQKNPRAAVGRFLKLLGYEFLAPGELGRILPANKNITLPIQKIDFAPRYLSSYFYMQSFIANRQDALDFFYANGMSPTFGDFGHNLHNIFTPSILKEYPILAPRVKKFASNKLYQHDITNPVAAEIAANSALDFFNKNPDAKGFSLGISDTVNFDIRVPQNKKPNDFKYGYANYSDAYFKFVNDTAKIVAQTKPNKFLGTLSYLTTEAAPSFKLQPNIAVFCTTDHALYYDESFKKSDFKKLENWSQSGAKILGLYSYVYGSSYQIPRNIEYYEYQAINKAYENGFKFLFAESCANWPYDNFKIWLMLKLVSASDNSSAPDSYDNLCKDFFKKYYEESAPYALEFFNLSQSAYQNRKDYPKWLGLYMRNTSAELFPIELLNKMEATLLKAENSAIKKSTADKLFELRLEFEHTKAFCADYFAKKNIFTALFDTSNAPLLISNSVKAEKFSNLSAKVRDTFSKFPSSNITIANTFKPAYDTLFLKDFKKFNTSDFELIKESLGDEKFDTLKQAATSPKNTIFFSDFSYPDYSKYIACVANFPPQFRAFTYPDKNASFCILESPQNKYRVRIANVNESEISAKKAAQAGNIYIFSAELNFQISISSNVKLEMVFTDQTGKILGRESASIAPLNETKECALKIVGKAPENTKFIGFGLTASQVKGTEFVEIKSFKLEKISQD